MELWQTGMSEHVWLKKIIGLNKADQCFAKTEKASSNIRMVRIKLEDLSSAFMILGLIGVGLSLLHVFRYRNRGQLYGSETESSSKYRGVLSSLLSQFTVARFTCPLEALLLFNPPINVT